MGTIKQRAIKKKEESLHHKHKNVGLEGEKTSVRAFLLHILWIVSHMAVKHTHTATKDVTLNKKCAGLFDFSLI